MTHVLFVCTANICRSAYAEVRARQLVGSDAGVTFASAGVRGWDGAPMDAGMAAEAVRRGVDPSDFRSRPLTRGMIEAADLVLTFEFAQHMRVLDLAPRHARTVFGLRQFADAVAQLGRRVALESVVAGAPTVLPPDGMELDIADPYRRGAQACAQAAARIDAALTALLPVVGGRVVPPSTSRDGT